MLYLFHLTLMDTSDFTLPIHLFWGDYGGDALVFIHLLFMHTCRASDPNVKDPVHDFTVQNYYC